MASSSRDIALQQLVRLGDMMGDGLHHENPAISTDYNKLVRSLFPKVKKCAKRKRKPARSFINSLSPCLCGSMRLKLASFESGFLIYCPSCQSNSKGEVGVSRNHARDLWNNSVQVRRGGDAD